jgi:hypothetical protein
MSSEVEWFGGLCTASSQLNRIQIAVIVESNVIKVRVGKKRYGPVMLGMSLRRVSLSCVSSNGELPFCSKCRGE